MPNLIAFNASMPKAGSELLQVLLSQHPDIYGSAISPLIDLLWGARNNMQGPEAKCQSPELMREAFLNFCYSGIHGYYDSITSKSVAVDKSRGALINYEFLKAILGVSPKIIIMVRDLRSVVASFEKTFKKTRYLPGPDNPQEGLNLTRFDRVTNCWFGMDPLGRYLLCLRDFLGGRLLLDEALVLRYEDLLTDPQHTMNRVYRYLEVDLYANNFENIKKTVYEHDAVHGPFGGHAVNPQLSPLIFDHEEVLGKDLCESILKNYTWFYDTFYPEGVV